MQKTIQHVGKFLQKSRLLGIKEKSSFNEALYVTNSGEFILLVWDTDINTDLEQEGLPEAGVRVKTLSIGEATEWRANNLTGEALTRSFRYDYLHVNLRIKTVRKQRDITQAELAKGVGVTQTQISFYEAGKQPLSLERFFQMCSVLKTPPAQILDGMSQIEPKTDRGAHGE